MNKKFKILFSRMIFFFSINIDFKKYYKNFFQGCYKKVEDMAIKHLNWVIGISVGVLALQILGIIFAFCLCKAIGHDRDYHYKYWHRDVADRIPQSQAHNPQNISEQQTFLQNLQWISNSKQKRLLLFDGHPLSVYLHGWEEQIVLMFFDDENSK